MADEARLRRLLEEILEFGRTPEDACRDCPELLPEVRARLRVARAVEAELEAMFPTPRVGGGAAPRAEPGLPRIPGYGVEGILGRGGMGVVYRARHLGLNRPVAIKMLLSGGFAGPPEIARFRREAEAVARLKHAHIVQVYDVGELEGRPYFTMELMEGGSLAQRLGGTPQPAGKAVSLVSTVAAAVQAAHDGGVIHRDLKPANILLAADGAPKVSDFGLARRIDDGPALTLTGATLGTPSYMAPEQAAGMPGAIGPAVDIYALGALLYELLTGRPPFRADTAAETERQVIAEEPALPSRLNAKVPRDLETICMKCLRKDPRQRYPSARELAEDLGRFQRGEPIAARPVGRPERLVRWARRKPATAALVLTALAFVAVAFVAAMREAALAAEQRAEAAKWESRLEFVIGLQRQGRFAEARTILGRVPDAGSEDLRQRISQALRELGVVERLDAIRMNRAASGKDDFGRAQAGRDYQAAFAAAGLGTVDEPPARVAERIVATGMGCAIVEAIDDWVFCATDRGRVAWLLKVARLADPDPAWGDRVRDPTLWENGAALAELARAAPIAERSVPLLLVLAGLLEGAGGDAVGFLRRVQAAHPADFWANFTLAEALGAADEAIGFYRAAMAVRPQALAAYVNIGNALAGLGRTDEAIGYWRRALEIDPRSALARLNLAIGLLNRGEPEQALEHLEETIRVAPELAMAHAAKGHALLDIARPDEAEVALRCALEALPEGDPRHAYVVQLMERCDRERAAVRRLSSVVQGVEKPIDGAEGVDLARLALRTGRYAAACELYADAFTVAPALAADPGSGDRYNAACAAALVAAGRDPDVGAAPEDVRARWRKLALDWLREDLLSWVAVADQGAGPRLGALRETLDHWRTDPDLATLREPGDLERLPASEREACGAIWADLDALLARVSDRQ